MGHKTIDNKQGHWVLAQMGKRVLRPGGLELTEKMISHLDINTNDDVVEFAPGLGVTAQMTLSKNPKTYTGVDLNEEAVSLLLKKIHGEGRKIIIGDASESGLLSESYNKVYGEAMLSMQSRKRKTAIIQEAHRLLKKGGLYGIHELLLTPDDIDDNIKNTMHKSMSKAIKVDVRALTVSEWTELFEENGFKVIATESNPMHLLEPKRVFQDEGFFRTLKIVFNILTHPQSRKRILAMRRVFREHQANLQSVSIVAEKT